MTPFNTSKPLLIVFLLTLLGHGYAVAGPLPGLVITPGLQFSYADKLFREQDYMTAQVEFKRFAHFFPDHSRTEEAKFKAAVSLYHSDQFNDAARLFNTLIREAGNENSFIRESYFMQSKSFLAMGNAGYAQLVLQNYLKLTKDTKTKDKIYLELARIHIREFRNLNKAGLDEAEQYLTMISPDSKDEYNIPAQLDTIAHAKEAPAKSPALSGILAIIPGGGFLYCERYKDAFVTFCLNAGLMYAAYDAFNKDNPALGGIITFVESGFYAGNIYGSISSAHKYNRSQQIKILNQSFGLSARINPVNNSYVLTLNHSF